MMRTDKLFIYTAILILTLLICSILLSPLNNQPSPEPIDNALPNSITFQEFDIVAQGGWIGPNGEHLIRFWIDESGLYTIKLGVYDKNGVGEELILVEEEVAVVGNKTFDLEQIGFGVDYKPTKFIEISSAYNVIVERIDTDIW